MKIKKDIKLARHAGFCYGVKRAVDLSIKIKKDNPDVHVYILGQLIHNNQVIEDLNKLGIITLEEIPEQLEGICIIRTHGVTPQTIENLQSKGCQIVDATCPDVKRVQDKAKDLAKDGYRVIIIGKPDHPEVVAIKAHADLCSEKPAIVISSKKEAENIVQETKSSDKIGVVIQTTQLIDNFKEILPVIAENARELKVYNTLCAATFQRQQSAKELAEEVELMVVVGSKSSANTTHLAEILRSVKTTVLIETCEELANYKDYIEKAQKIGVTAGASTPEYVINNVIKKIGELNS